MPKNEKQIYSVTIKIFKGNFKLSPLHKFIHKHKTPNKRNEIKINQPLIEEGNIVMAKTNKIKSPNIHQIILSRFFIPINLL